MPMLRLSRRRSMADSPANSVPSSSRATKVEWVRVTGRTRSSMPKQARGFLDGGDGAAGDFSEGGEEKVAEVMAAEAVA